MKFYKACYLIATIVCSLGTCTLAQIPQSPNNRNAEGLRDGHWTLLFDEQWRAVTDPHKAKYYRLISYDAGKPVGVTRDFYMSGKPAEEGELISENPENWTGHYTGWFESGAKEVDCFYVNGKMEGVAVTYYENGMKRNEIHCRDGRKDGAEIMYCENGQKEHETWYKEDNKEDGTEIYWYPSGKKKMEISITKGRTEKSVGYYESGSTSFEVHYKDGEQDGVAKYWDEQGNLTTKYWKNGLVMN